MKKPIIGIVPFITKGCEEIPYAGNYITCDYIKKLQDSNAEVITLSVSNGEDSISEEVLSLCDGLVIMGGNYIWPYHLKVIEYADENNIPFLGICLGMQIMSLYSSGVEDKKIADLKREVMIDHDPIINNELERGILVHDVRLTEGSIIHKLFGDKVAVNSRHEYYAPVVKSPFKATGRSEDGIIEVIEYENDDKFMIGVQWHPEAMDTMKPLFDLFIEKTKTGENK